ncbi:MAG: helicase-associated domain-containing protein [Mycobacterium leprae]
MLLSECLTKAPADQLERIALSVGMGQGVERDTQERQLAGALLDRPFLQGLLADLSDEEWAALKVVFFNGGDQGITVELCYQIVNLLSGRRRKTAPRALEGLLDRGLVYLRTREYRQVFFIPQDLLAVLSDILNRQMIYRLCLPPEAKVIPLLPERDLVEDLYRFLAYVRKNEITLTQQGQIFKRHLRALLDLLFTPTDDEEGLVGRYPEPLGLLVSYALDRHLIMREEGLLVPSSELLPWIGGPTGAKQLDLFSFWQDRYYYQDLQTFLSMMRSVQERWVSVNRLVQEVEPLINPSQRGSFLLRLKHHLTTFLEPMGLVELARVEDEPAPPTAETDEAADQVDVDLVCRLTPAGMEILQGRVPPEPESPGGPSMLLQATFEVIVTRPAAPELLWHLELMADLEKRTDRTLTYHLSRQSIYRALKAGSTGEEILQFLQAHSATGVPQNVAFDLRSWAETYGQVYLQAVTMLRCATPILAEQIKASRRTGPYVLGELSPTDLIVKGSQYKELLEALQADGLMPRPEIERLD